MRNLETLGYFPAVVVALTLLAAADATAARPQATEQELQTAQNLAEAHEAMGNLRALPGGCPATGLGVVELAAVFETAELPAPGSVVRDGWGNPVMAWCAGMEWAVISTGRGS